MNGRTEHKIKVEQKIVQQIHDDKEFNLFGFYNYISSKYEHKTKESYIIYIRKFLRCMNKDISKITSEDINEYLNNLTYKKDENNQIKETSGTYRATIHSALKLYFQYLSTNNIIPNDPMLLVPRPKRKQDNQIDRIYLNPEELQVIINNIKNDKKNTCWKDRDLLILMIFLYTGIRCTALTEINVEDVDVVNQTLTIIDKRNKKRIFKIDEDVINLYKKIVVKNNELKVRTNALFISNRYDRISSRTVSRIIEKYSADLDKHVTPHKLRRSYGTNLYKETGDLYAVKNALGHEDIRTTQIYVEANNTEAAEKGMMSMKSKLKFQV